MHCRPAGTVAEVEHPLIAALDLPLNLEGNARNGFHIALSRVRRLL
jgi:hypothetical protein